jgi:hypothetical protein
MNTKVWLKLALTLPLNSGRMTMNTIIKTSILAGFMAASSTFSFAQVAAPATMPTAARPADPGNAARLRGRSPPINPEDTRAAGSATGKYTCWEFVTWRLLPSGPTGTNPIENPQAGPNQGPMHGTWSNFTGGRKVNSASECHGMTRDDFKNSERWSPKSVCESMTQVPLGNTVPSPGVPGLPNGGGLTVKYVPGIVEVWALDRFKEISENPQKYNKVAGYKVDCWAITREDTLQIFPPW